MTVYCDYDVKTGANLSLGPFTTFINKLNIIIAVV